MRILCSFSLLARSILWIVVLAIFSGAVLEGQIAEPRSMPSSEQCAAGEEVC